jgi:hypothetical protein
MKITPELIWHGLSKEERAAAVIFDEQHPISTSV